MSQSNMPECYKSSAEILSELFSSFNAEPPNLDEKLPKKHKKSKKKHKHKDKKHKKKSKHKYSSESSDSSDKEPHKHKSKKRKETDLDAGGSNIFNLNSADLLSSDKVESSELSEGLVNSSVQSQGNDAKNSKCKEVKSVAENVEENSGESKGTGSEKTQPSSKITIKNLKNSTVYEATLKEVEEKAREKAAKFEEGELTTDSENEDAEENSITNLQVKESSEPSSTKHERKRKHKDSSKDKTKREDSKKSKRDKHKRRTRSRDRTHHSSRRDKEDNYHYKSSRHYSYYSKSRDEKRRSRSRSKDRSRSRQRDRSRDRSPDKSRDRDRDRSDRDRSDRDRPERDRSDRDRSERDRSDRDRSERKKRRSKSPSSSIDKKKLLEIARKNAINMLKSGTLPEALTLGPQAQEKVIAAIKAGGKTIEELTDFCKNLSKKEELGELSSVSSNEEEVDSNSEGEKVFHHPFQIKDKPTSIVMNIKNSTPIPVKTSKEKSAELRMQFPVSSGQLHRKTENEWVPVSPKKSEVSPTPQSANEAVTPVVYPAPVPKPVAPPVAPVVPPPPVPPPPSNVETVSPAVVTAPMQLQQISNIALPPTPTELDIGAIVSQRLSAMRRLQENPNDVQALSQMYRVQQEMQSWAQSKQQPGQFTGSTGAHILSPAELSAGYQAWARKDQLQNAAPVTGGMGMHLLQKMGWKPGEGLGKEKTGSLEPLLLEVKLDKKGLVANEEVKGKRPVKVSKAPATVKTLAGKHPVSLLGEYATKRKLGAPQYELCFECGPDHKKNFLFKVILNGIEYKPNVVSSTKKQAKADAATVCLQQLGILTS